ncbi:head-tail connector protein [Rhodoligotrophos defluvii]|uniref:head-tail connector protein n=1 Tax=Rhodoligotrophos defluvii TaxID=2561934 RepID=UPI001484E133|nr:head-tail connector protein [Rhodoligotrophos defluvii]
MMSVPNSPPAVEPVSLEQARGHLRVDGAFEDELIAALITSARIHLEIATRRIFITQGWSVFLDDWPKDGIITLPIRPVQTVDRVLVYGDDGEPELVDPAIYVADTGVLPRLKPRTGKQWPRPERAFRGIEIEVTAGYGDEPETVPATLRQAILQLVAHWYENREPVGLGDQPFELPAMIKALIAPYRVLAL